MFAIPKCSTRIQNIYNIVQSNTTVINILFIGLGRHVSIRLESLSGLSIKGSIYLYKYIYLYINIYIYIYKYIYLYKYIDPFIEGPDDDSNGIETCRPSPINNILMIVVLEQYCIYFVYITRY